MRNFLNPTERQFVQEKTVTVQTGVQWIDLDWQTEAGDYITVVKKNSDTAKFFYAGDGGTGFFALAENAGITTVGNTVNINIAFKYEVTT